MDLSDETVKFICNVVAAKGKLSDEMRPDYIRVMLIDRETAAQRLNLFLADPKNLLEKAVSAWVITAEVSFSIGYEIAKAKYGGTDDSPTN